MFGCISKRVKHSEYVAVQESELCLIPEEMGFFEAESLPPVGITAVTALWCYGKIQSG